MQSFDLRDDFPFLSRQIDGVDVVYLDSAATSLKPNCVIEAITHFYQNVATNVHRGKSYVTEEASNIYEQTRYKVANFIRCSGNEVVFCKNTTEAINMVALGLELDSDDWILVCSDAHHSNFLPWQQNAKTRYVGLLDDGSLDLETYYKLLEEKPKLAAITHCSNATGLYLPVKEMIEAAHKHGVLTLMDAAQSIPHKAIDVQSLDVDFMAFSAHKVLGPTGLGILYGKKALLEELKPMQWGGGMVDWVALDNTQTRKLPHRLEAGTPNISAVFGFNAALDYIDKLGMENIEKYDNFLSDYIVSKILENKRLTIIGGVGHARSSTTSFSIQGVSNLDDLSRILSDSYGIICRTGHLCAQPLVSAVAGEQVMRISAYVYTTTEDIDFFFNSLSEILDFM
ncbi:cysteine desulfurase [Pseudoalteromonas amylolytica]|uniref:cysteine desulfurase n=2 Tax=Pseudoalteromonas TaxID=53246 RepID=A0A1S1MTK2_9GAMM|nr:cysteine desulfurase [Pseudoalteromonas sp. JW3]OHU90182.1 cysteine desulfurase [Pseudoalteromonas amylolytica]